MILLDEGTPIPVPELRDHTHSRFLPQASVIAVRKRHKEHYKQTGVRLCNWCGGEVKNTSRRSYCSDVCARAMELRTFSNAARYALKRRDKEVCAKCGLDTKSLFRRVVPHSCWYEWKQIFCRRNGIEASYYLSDEYDALWTVFCKRRIEIAKKWKARWPEYAMNHTSFWNADHIVEVRDGGGSCGLENFQTLCRRCHNAKTKATTKKHVKRRKRKFRMPRPKRMKKS